MAAWYNEHDPFAAAWLRELIARNLIAPGEVDERSIVDVQPDDLRGFEQCHFFAGIGVWSYALRRAGWPDDRPVWTGSCPCQPFSAAGKGEGYADERHLWPHWLRLIREFRPAAILGEQVDAAIRTGWLDDVCLSLEQLDYAVGAVSFPACSVGAPHIRQRLYFVADASDGQWRGRADNGSLLAIGTKSGWNESAGDVERSRTTGELADAYGRNASAEREQRSGQQRLLAPSGGTGELADLDLGARGQRRADARGRDQGSPAQSRTGSGGGERVDFMGDSEQPRLEGHGWNGDDRNEPGRLGADATRSVAEAGPVNGFWHNAEWLPCIDGKARPVEPGTFPLAHGAPARVGRLRGYGNAICAPQAEEFVRAYMDRLA